MDNLPADMLFEIGSNLDRDDYYAFLMALPTKRMCELAGRRKIDHAAWKKLIDYDVYHVILLDVRLFDSPSSIVLARYEAQCKRFGIVMRPEHRWWISCQYSPHAGLL